ncbi:hypothetical protein TWF694_006629 [Orbilia ellipsospora]|uniref:DUF7580 domain-containing protein n=1 Tax=Orbilia ellipsospora TaxID=2528407 RepID=A0AAV9XLL7_9PEZI
MDVAGVVLGALPILYGAVQTYKETIQIGKRFFGKRKYVEKLANSLFFHKGTLTEVIRHLLINGGCDCISDFEEDPYHYLNDDDVKKRLHDYLGSETETVLITKLGESVGVIKKISKSIAGLVSDFEVPTDDLVEIIKKNRDQKARQVDFVPRVKLMFSAGDIKSATQDLEASMNSLCHFIKLVCDNRRAVVEKPSRNATKLAQGVRRVQKLANNLHVALSRSWKAGCHPKHGAKLFLDDRLNAASDPKRSNPASQIVFDLIFEADHQGQALWHETIVKAIEESNDASQSSGACRVTLVVPQVMATPATLTIINDLCGVIEGAKCNKQPIALFLSLDQQIGSMPTDKDILPRYFHGNETPLRQLLSSDPKSAHRDCPIPLDMRMLLALRVASNLLQLFKTQWLQRAWSKNEIFFPVTSAKKAPDFGRPFVSVLFEQCNQRGASPDDVELRMAITELGILLLEIWHGKTFETQYDLQGIPALRYQRRALAFDWMEDISYPPPILYYDAVAYCIVGINHGEARQWESDDPRLWRALCQNILAPLSKNCEGWGSRSSC